MRSVPLGRKRLNRAPHSSTTRERGSRKMVLRPIGKSSRACFRRYRSTCHKHEGRQATAWLGTARTALATRFTPFAAWGGRPRRRPTRSNLFSVLRCGIQNGLATRKDGLKTRSLIPSPAANPWTNVVFPVPSLPSSQNVSAWGDPDIFKISVARNSPSFLVRLALVVRMEKRGCLDIRFTDTRAPRYSAPRRGRSRGRLGARSRWLRSSFLEPDSSESFTAHAAWPRRVRE